MVVYLKCMRIGFSKPHICEFLMRTPGGNPGTAEEAIRQSGASQERPGSALGLRFLCTVIFCRIFGTLLEQPSPPADRADARPGILCPPPLHRCSGRACGGGGCGGVGAALGRGFSGTGGPYITPPPTGRLCAPLRPGMGESRPRSHSGSHFGSRRLGNTLDPGPGLRSRFNDPALTC